MHEIKRTTIFDCTAGEYLESASDINYPQYIIDNEEDIIQFDIIKSELLKNNNFYQECIGQAKIFIPNFLINIIGNKSYKFTELSYTNHKLLKKRIIIKSKLLDILNSKIQTLYILKNIENQKCIKETVTFFESSLPLLGSSIEKYMHKKLTNQLEINDNRAGRWIKYWKTNYRSLSDGFT
jgi:hypothetical protein